MTLLATYNMQGGGNWTNVGPMLRGTQLYLPNNPYQEKAAAADVACLQECGAPPDPRGEAKLVSKDLALCSMSYGGMAVWWVVWGTGNTRCSLAIVTRHLVKKWHVVPVIDDGSLRPLLGLKIAFPDRMKGTWIYSCHMPSGNHGFASSRAYDVIKGGQLGGDWILAGDFNCTPQEFANPPGKRAWDDDDAMPVHSKKATHQSGNNLDYAVSPKVALKYYATQAMSSDHYAVWFAF